MCLYLVDGLCTRGPLTSHDTSPPIRTNLTVPAAITCPQGDPFWKDPGVCRDSNVGACTSWSKSGECEKNQEYMKVQSHHYVLHPVRYFLFTKLPYVLTVALLDRFQRTCAFSCKGCEPCTESDREALSPCYWRNRQKMNYLVFNMSELTFNVDDIRP